jgi:hypothetical protein
LLLCGLPAPKSPRTPPERRHPSGGLLAVDELMPMALVHHPGAMVVLWVVEQAPVYGALATRPV